MKKKFDFWVWMVKKDKFFIWLGYAIRGVRTLWGWKFRKWTKEGKARIAQMQANGRDMLIVLNGPSIAKQPLRNAAGRNCDVVFVNQGFRHPDYKTLQPKYHVFVDTKLIHGIWDIKWLDEILEMVPDITFVMPAEWGNLDLFKPYKERGVSILWVTGGYDHGVSGSMFKLAFDLGYKNIFFTGYEGTAFASALVKQSSHFYGTDLDEETMSPETIMKIYLMNAKHFRAAIETAEIAERKGINLVNLTHGGIMNMFTRQSFDAVFPPLKGR